jgi:hypothetical protein
MRVRGRESARKLGPIHGSGRAIRRRFNGATFCSVSTAAISVGFPKLAVQDGRFTGSTVVPAS